MKTGIILATVLTAVGLAGCNTLGPSPEAIAARDNGYLACKATAKTKVELAHCFERVEAQYVAPYARDKDLLALEQAQRGALAEKVDSGEMTAADAKAQLAGDISAATSESERRTTNRQIAAAAMLSSIPTPVTCTTYGATTNCY
jgi:hypothetical protein